MLFSKIRLNRLKQINYFRKQMFMHQSGEGNKVEMNGRLKYSVHCTRGRYVWLLQVSFWERRNLKIPVLPLQALPTMWKIKMSPDYYNWLIFFQRLSFISDFDLLWLLTGLKGQYYNRTHGAHSTDLSQDHLDQVHETLFALDGAR